MQETSNLKVYFHFSDEIIESTLITNNFTYTQVYYNDLEPADDSAKLSVPFDTHLSNKLKSYKNEDIKVQIRNGESNYLTGYLRKTTSFSKRIKNDDIELEIVNPSYLLDKNIDEALTLTNCRIDTVITKLLNACKFSLIKELNIPTIIPFFQIEEDEKIKDKISQLCREYGYTFNFDTDGYFTLYPIFNQPPTVINQIFNGDEANCIGTLKMDLKEEEADSVTANWCNIKFVENTLVFSDSSNGDPASKLKCVIQVKPNSYLFDNENNILPYDSDLGEIKFVTSITPDFKHDAQIEIKRCTNCGTKAILSAFNNSQSGQYRFTQLDIKGDAFIKTANNVTGSGAGNKNTKEIDLAYIYDKDLAEQYVKNLVNYYRYADFTITLKSTDDFELGSFCQVTASGFGTITGRIIQKKSELIQDAIEYKIEGISEFEPAVVNTTSIITAKPSYITADKLTNYRTETRYKRSENKPDTPTGIDPNDWTTFIPDGTESIWITTASFNYDGTISTTWNTPTKFSFITSAIGQLTNDNATIFFDESGIGNYAGIQTSLLVYEGGKNTTSTWIIGATPSLGVTGTLNGATYTVTGLTSESGFIDIIANRSGMDTITKRFTIIKAPQGRQESYSLIANSAVIIARNDGTCTPSSVSLSSTCNHGTESSEAYSGIYKLFIDDTLAYTSSPTSTYTFDPYTIYPYPSSNKLPSNSTIPTMALIDHDIVRLRVELWDVTGKVKLDSQSVTVTKDVGISIEEILQGNTSIIADNTPKYLGKFLDSTPQTYRIGDWFLIYGYDDTPYQRGVYLVKSDLSLQRLTGDANQSSYFVQAMSDVLSVSNASYGSLENYGQITFIENLATNSLFTQSLIVQNSNLGSTIFDGGKIKTSLLDVDTILGNNATFRGTLDAVGGTFSGSLASGGFELNISPASTQSYTTNGKTAAVFINEILAAGVSLGTYACTGTYDGQPVNSIQLERPEKITTSWSTATSTRITGNSTVVNATTKKYEYIKISWRRLNTVQTFTATFTQADGTKKYASGETHPSEGWASFLTETLWTEPLTSPPSAIADPVGRTEYKDYTVVCKNGSVNFTAASFTFKLKNLPPYMTSLPLGTVCTIDDGDDYLKLVIKK